MINLDGQTRCNQEIEVDAGSFVGATLNRCLLIYRGGKLPNFSGLTVNDCRWSFQGTALNTLLMLALMRWGHPEKAEELLAQANSEVHKLLQSRKSQ